MKPLKPQIIITEDTVQELEKLTSKSSNLYGISRLNENLVLICSLEPKDDLKWVARFSTGKIGLKDFHHSIPISKVKPISFMRDFTSRAQGIVDTNLLSEKIISLVGIGTVGSQTALHLGQSGVGGFNLFDLDRLSVSNLSRHACDLHDLERFKTKALNDLILRRNPRTKIKTYEDDFLALEWDERVIRLQGSDLVISSTDSNAVQFAVNEVCAALGIPSLYVGCYERACAGEILFVIPGRTPCFNCFMEFRQSHLSEIKRKERPIPYSNEESSPLISEPGLAIDIAYTVSVASAYALALLLPDSERGGLLDPERNLILVHAGIPPKEKYREIFRMPFDFIQARVKRDKECPICQKSLATRGGTDGSTTDLG